LKKRSSASNASVVQELFNAANKLSTLLRGECSMSSKLLLQNMMFYGFHGVHEYERELGQRFHVDVEITADLSKSEKSDKPEDGIDYTSVYGHVKEVVENHRYYLLEALSAHIAEMLLKIVLAQEVTVRVRKSYTSIPGQFEYIQVETTRKKWA
jgi:dihydroneopterin aldolase